VNFNETFVNLTHYPATRRAYYFESSIIHKYIADADDADILGDVVDASQVEATVTEAPFVIYTTLFIIHYSSLELIVKKVASLSARQAPP
jgi:hypothetical protein